MTRRRSIFGLLAICALASCALAAASASGATLYVCEEVAKGTGKWADSKCEEAKAGGNFDTVAPPENVAKSVVGTGIGTAVFTLPVITPATGLTVSCSQQATTANATNRVVGGQMQNVGESLSLKMSECAVTAPAGQGCKISGGAIEFSLATATASGSEAGLKVELLPAAETVATIVLEGCSKVPGMTLAVKGKLVGAPSGSSLVFTKASTEGFLNFGGEKAYVEATIQLTAGGKRTMIE